MKLFVDEIVYFWTNQNICFLKNEMLVGNAIDKMGYWWCDEMYARVFVTCKSKVNTLAYYGHESIMEKWSVVTMAPDTHHPVHMCSC